MTKATANCYEVEQTHYRKSGIDWLATSQTITYQMATTDQIKAATKGTRDYQIIRADDDSSLVVEASITYEGRDDSGEWQLVAVYDYCGGDCSQYRGF